MLRRTSLLQHNSLFSLPHLNVCRGISSSSFANSEAPHLIFGERHTDPVSAIYMNELIPELKKINYELFYDEVPHNESLRTVANNMKLYQKNYDGLKKLMLDKNLNIEKDEDVAAFILPYEAKKPPEILQKNVQKFISRVAQLRMANC